MIYGDINLRSISGAYYILSSLGYIVTFSNVPPINYLPDYVKIKDYSNLDSLISQIPGGIRYNIWQIEKGYLKPIALKLEEFDFVNIARLIFGLPSLFKDSENSW